MSDAFDLREVQDWVSSVMKATRTCSRCDAPLDPDTEPHAVLANGAFLSHRPERIICRPCRDSFKDWWDAGQVRELEPQPDETETP